MSILVCGGAGYIGSHAVHQLVEKGEEVVIVDNLQTGHLDAVNPAAKFYEGDIREAAVLDRIFTENKIEAVIHFAANSLVGESMEKPLKYFNNNVYGVRNSGRSGIYGHKNGCSVQSRFRIGRRRYVYIRLSYAGLYRARR